MRHRLRGLIGIAAAAATVAVGVPGVADAASTWTVQSVPLPSGATTTDLTGVSCTSATNCEAVMDWNQSFPGAEHWNGSSWTVQDFPANAYVYPTSVSCSSAASCMAAGFFEGTGYVQAYAESWNGSSWAYSPVIGYSGSQLYGVSCPSATHCMAVGYASTSGTGGPLAEKWNGTVWKDVPVPAPSGENDGTLNSVSCVSAAGCVAVGWTGLSGAPQMLAYTWNGTSWIQQTLPAPAGAPDPVLTGVSCVSASNCTAVGDNNAGGDGGNTVFAEHWNGSAWTVQDLPLPTGTSASSLASVSCVAAGCTAAGRYFPATATSYKGWHALAEFFTGTRWSVQATAIPSSRKFFTSVSCVAARTCTAVGSSITAPDPGGNQPLAEQE